MAEYRIVVRDSRERLDFPGGSRFSVSEASGNVEFSEIYLQKKAELSLEKSSENFLFIPLHGELTVDEGYESKIIWPSEIAIFNSENQLTIQAGEEEMSRFFLINTSRNVPEGFYPYSSELRNKLQKIIEGNVNVALGIFDGREETEFNMTKENAFVTCINGAFEFQNRLIETSDSLIIKNDSLLEMEALSENAIVLILEF